MQISARDQLLAEIDRLLSEGQALLGTQRTIDHYAGMRVSNPITRVDLTGFSKWRAGCLNLLRLLGPKADAWKNAFEKIDNGINAAKVMFGTLQGIKDAANSNLLVSIEDIVFAEAYADLLEQAEHLLSENYYIAAGVLGRAVLEEHLRKWCQNGGCVLSKPRPTMGDFYGELQKASKINKIEVEHVKSLAAVGNAAAHNEATLKREDVERLIREVKDFLIRHPIS